MLLSPCAFADDNYNTFKEAFQISDDISQERIRNLVIELEINALLLPKDFRYLSHYYLSEFFRNKNDFSNALKHSLIALGVSEKLNNLIRKANSISQKARLEFYNQLDEDYENRITTKQRRSTIL